MAEIKGLYLGRFQPFHRGHLDTTRKILQRNPFVDLSIGVADWKGPRNKDNFLTGEEAKTIIRLSLDDACLYRVGVVTAELRPETGLVDVVRRVVEDGYTHIFSGSEKTLAAVNRLVEMGVAVNATDLQDFGGGIRATSIRDSIINNTPLWRDRVTPSVNRFIMLRLGDLRERLKTYDSGEKRPWQLESNTTS